MRMRAVHVTLWVILPIIAFATGTSDNPLTGGKKLEYDCSQQELSLNFSKSIITTIGENFIKSALITCLSLDRNEVALVKNGAFDGLPALEYLNMAGNQIHDLFSFGGHENLRTLILANQSVYGTYELQFSEKYPQLRYLDLSDSKIDSFSLAMKENVYYSDLDKQLIHSTGIFPKLEYLDLSNNAINRFVYDNYEHSIFNLNLTHLFLHNNYFNYIDLRYFKNLIILTADRNNIQSLERNYCNSYSMCVSDMPQLKYLSISNNQLYRVDRDFFAFMPELSMLNLSNNQLTDNMYGVFSELFSLEDLDLDNNQLTNISMFKKPVQLSSLSINHNKISHIDSEDFINTPNLRKLYLNNNAIRNIREEAFGSLELLEELHLADNELTNLPVNWSNNLKSLQYLDLANNKFMFLESLSLRDTLPLITIDLTNNHIVSFTSKILRDIPENVTIHLIHDQRNVALEHSVS